MKVQLKYCGGCKPLFKRSDLCERILRKLKATPLSQNNGADDEKADFGLIVCGCDAQCADREEIRQKGIRWFVVGPHSLDYNDMSPEEIANHIKAVLDQT